MAEQQEEYFQKRVCVGWVWMGGGGGGEWREGERRLHLHVPCVCMFITCLSNWHTLDIPTHMYIQYSRCLALNYVSMHCSRLVYKCVSLTVCNRHYRMRGGGEGERTDSVQQGTTG